MRIPDLGYNEELLTVVFFDGPAHDFLSMSRSIHFRCINDVYTVVQGIPNCLHLCLVTSGFRRRPPSNSPGTNPKIRNRTPAQSLCHILVQGFLFKNLLAHLALFLCVGMKCSIPWNSNQFGHTEHLVSKCRVPLRCDYDCFIWAWNELNNVNPPWV